ncbi:MAG: hypothetical protein HY235_29915 [Acidobacteria bacterium]|nr:hypothetical protein [Acidobacteriota bacterium]
MPYAFEYYMDHQDLFRPLIFKTYLPHWHLWRPLEHLVDEYERMEREGGAGKVTLRPGDDIKIMALLEQRCTPHEMQVIRTNIKMGRVREELATAFCVLYRKEYPLALERAQRDFRHSDFLHEWEFFAMKFRKVPPNTPYEKRPPGKLVATVAKIYMQKS